MARDPLDRYYTPAWLGHALLEHVAIMPGERVLEPCAGAGHLVRVLRSTGAEVITGDIDPDVEVDWSWDFVDFAKGHLVATRYDWVVSNPPYSTDDYAATDFVEAALRLADWVAMLLRVTWLEPCAQQDRRGLLFEYDPPSLVIVCPRGSFVMPKRGTSRSKGATEHVTCAWFVWSPPSLIARETKLRWVHQRDVLRLSGQQELAL